MQEWDNIKIRASQQIKLGRPLKLTSPMHAPKFTACIRGMLQLREVHDLPAFKTEVPMETILERGNVPLADFLRKTAPFFNAMLARYLTPGDGAAPTPLVTCMVGGRWDQSV